MREITEIKALCEKHRTEPKILLIPSRRMKTQILKLLVDNGVNPLNLTVKTIKELAYSVAENSIAKSRLTFIEFRETTDIISDILKGLQARDSLCFFDKVEITFGICTAISKTVLELFDSGYLYGNVNLGQIENANKRKDLETIISAYVLWKNENNCIDHTDIANMAFEYTEQYPLEYVSGYALQACEFTVIEKRLVDKLNLWKGNVKFRNEVKSDVRLQAKQVEFFESYGEYNEVKEVMRRILKEKIPFDNVLVVASSSEPYAQLFYQLLQQYTYKNDSLPPMEELPITFGTGLPLLLSSPAKLLLLLLDWIGNGYRSHEFISIFSSDMFDIKRDQRDAEGNLPELDEQFGKLVIINLINNAGLTWQRRSYIPCLKKHLAYVQEHNSQNKKIEKAITWLLAFVSDAFEKIPETDDDGMVDVATLLSSLKEIIRAYSRVFSVFDNQGLRMTLQELNTSLIGRRVNLNEAVEIIKEHMKNIRILSDSPSPGKMHFTTYQQAAWIDRNNVFLVGMGADNFPGMTIEDPLLLDNERMSPPMLTSVNRINKNIEIMTSFLEEISGNLTCSFSYYDTVEIRECYPTTLFYRLQDIFPNEKCKRVEFVLNSNDCFLDFSDYWIYHGVKHGAVGGEEEIKIDMPMWSLTDENIELELSASSLTAYLQCKYKYFLKHILKLKKIKREDFDILGWLSALETGNVYHKIFEAFVLHTIENPNILQSRETAVSYIHKITEEEIAVFEKELPAASVFHVEKQREEIMKNVTKFAEYEVLESSVRKPEFTELDFGKDELIIDLGEEWKIKVSGTIDRIDRMKNGSVEIIDYKTGSARTLKKLRTPQDVGIDEANVQLALYYLALKEASHNPENHTIKNIDAIKKLSYRFVTAKGNYDIISLTVSSDSEESYKAALKELCKEIKKGEFPPEKGQLIISDDNERKVDCRYCDYNTVCNFAFADAEQEAR